jgi:hypothetical protein
LTYPAWFSIKKLQDILVMERLGLRACYMFISGSWLNEKRVVNFSYKGHTFIINSLTIQN